MEKEDSLNGGVKGESRREESGLVEENGQVTDGLVSGVLLNSALELLEDCVVRVDLEGLLALHVCGIETSVSDSPATATSDGYSQEDMEESRRAWAFMIRSTGKGQLSVDVGGEDAGLSTHCWTTIRTVQ